MSDDPGLQLRSAHDPRRGLREARLSGARAHAGGTDLLGCLRDGVFGADTVVSLSGIPDLRGVRKNLDGGLLVGAMTTLAEVAADPAVAAGYAALAEGALSAASPQLRNQGTLGGNLCQRPRCWYYRGDFHCARKGGDKCYAVEGENQFHCVFGGDVCFFVHPSDTAPALVALDATVRITGKDGSRSVPGREVLRRSRDRLHARDGARARRARHRDRPAAAAGRDPQHLPQGARARRVGLRPRRRRGRGDGRRRPRGRGPGSCSPGAAPVPWRVPEAEREVTGQRLTAQVARKAAAAAVKGAEPLAENGYKVELLRGAVEEALLRLA